MENGMNLLNTLVIPWAIKIVIAIAIFIVGRIIARWLTKLCRKAMGRANMDEMLIRFLGTITFSLLMICVVIASLSQLGINITSLLALLGAAGLAVGLALKDSLSNIASGIMIILFKPFRLGDYVVAGGEGGTIQEIGLFQTVMTTPDNQRIIVPNSAIMNGSITNVNALPTRRIDMVFGISYGDDIEKAKQVIRDTVLADERVLSDPELGIRIGELADNSVNILVRPWCKSEDYWVLRWDLMERLKLALEAGGMTIPFPQRDIHVFNHDTTETTTAPEEAGKAH